MIEYKKKIAELLKDSPDLSMFKYFYKKMFSDDYHIDVNGYTMIALIPGDFSGYGEQYRYQKLLETITKDFIFFATDFTPPEWSVDIKENTGMVTYATNTKPTNSLSVSFLDESTLKFFNFHNTWFNYIYDVTFGIVEPEDRYIENKELDYAGSAYILRFDYDGNTPVYIGKAVGVFPISLPTKEVIGSRASSDVTIFNINYTVSYYNLEVLTDGNSPIFTEFMQKLGSIYND